MYQFIVNSKQTNKSLVVMGGDRVLKVAGSHHIMDGHFFPLICLKIVTFV